MTECKIPSILLYVYAFYGRTMHSRNFRFVSFLFYYSFSLVVKSEKLLLHYLLQTLEKINYSHANVHLSNCSNCFTISALLNDIGINETFELSFGRGCNKTWNDWIRRSNDTKQIKFERNSPRFSLPHM